MYYRYFNPVYRPLSLGITRAPIRNFKSYKNTHLISTQSDNYTRDANGNIIDSKKVRDDRRREAITYIHVRPTFTQKILIWKTRFFATGWITALFIIITYLGVKFIKRFGEWSHRDRYSL